jgi:CRP-like cAMP-binding protein
LKTQGAFRTTVRAAIETHSIESTLVRVNRDNYVYARGQHDHAIYLVFSGQVKVVSASLAGRECITQLHGQSDMFGEICLMGDGEHPDSAIAQCDSILRRVTGANLIKLIRREQLSEALIVHLTEHLAKTQEAIANLLTGCNEVRLACALLLLSEHLPREHQQGACTILRLRQEELAEMIGTTRTRVGVFLQRFRELGLVDSDPDRCLMIFVDRLRTFIEQFASAAPTSASPTASRLQRASG